VFEKTTREDREPFSCIKNIEQVRIQEIHTKYREIVSTPAISQNKWHGREEPKIKAQPWCFLVLPTIEYDYASFNIYKIIMCMHTANYFIAEVH
jgi:hypothetical protein